MRVCLTFYRTLAIPLVSVSLICASQVWLAHSVYFILRVFWVKVLTSLVTGIYIFLFRSEQFIFYNNLGHSRGQLFVFSFALDFVLWLLMQAAVALML